MTGLMRILVSAEVRAANQALRSLQEQSAQTGASLQAVAPQADAASASIDNLGKSSSGLSDLKSNITGLASGLAIGGAIAGVALLVGAVSDYVTELKDAQKEQQVVSEGLAKGAADAQKDASEIRALGEIILDETQKRSTRNEAFQELQDKYPGYFKNLDLEKSSLQDIQVAMDKVTDALVRQAQIKGIEGAISDVYKQQADLLSKNFLSASTTFDKIKAFVSGGASLFAGAGSGNGIIGSLIGDQTDKAKEFDKQLDNLNTKLKQLIQTGIEAGDSRLKDKADTRETTEQTDKRLRILQEIKRIQDDLSKPNKEPLFKLFSDSDPNGINEQILNDKIRQTAKDAANDPTNRDAYAKLGNVLGEQLARSLSPDLHARIGNIEDIPGVKDLKEGFQGSSLVKTMKMTLPVEIKLKIDKQNELRDQMDSIDQQFAQIIKSGITNIAASFGEAIGDVFGDKLHQGLQKVARSVASVLKELGKFAIQTGIEVLGFKKVISAFLISHPELAIIAGIGLEAFAGVIESKFSGAHAFAEGGIVTGPTIGLIGEAGPEVVFPLNKLNDFARNMVPQTQTGFVAATKISGNDMIILINRANKNRGLSN